MTGQLSIFEEIAGAGLDGNTKAKAVTLREDDILHIRSLYHPPAILKRLLEAVYWLLMAPRLVGRPPTEKVSWVKVQFVVNSPNFTQMLWNYDAAVLRRAPLVVKHLVVHYFGPNAPGGALRVSAVKRANERAGVLFQWAAAKLAEATAAEVPEPPPPPKALSPRRSPCGTPECLLPPPTPPGIAATRACGSSASAPQLRPLPLQIGCLSRLSPRGSTKGSAPRSPKRSPLSPCSPTRRRMLRLRAACGGKASLAIHGFAPSPKGAESWADVALLRTTVIVAGRCRKVSLTVARSLFQRPNTLVLVLVHGAEDCAVARYELRDLQGASEGSRLEVLQFDIDDVETATMHAKQIMCRYPSIKGLVIDAKGLPQMPTKWATEYDACWAVRGATAVFEALRPHFAAGARVLALSSRCGADGALKLSREQHELFFQEGLVDELSLETVAATFQADLAEAAARGRSIPCRSLGGWWLDKEAFSFTLLHALVGVWHRRHMRLVVSTCACVPAPGENCDAEEAVAVTEVLAKPPSASKQVAGRLVSNGAEVASWLHENRLERLVAPR